MILLLCICRILLDKWVPYNEDYTTKRTSVPSQNPGNVPSNYVWKKGKPTVKKKIVDSLAIKGDAEIVSTNYNDPMYLEILVPADQYPYRGEVHYRQAGEQHPLCGQVRSKWRIITRKAWVDKYIKNNFCKSCVEQKLRLERSITV